MKYICVHIYGFMQDNICPRARNATSRASYPFNFCKLLSPKVTPIAVTICSLACCMSQEHNDLVVEDLKQSTL